MAMLPPVLLYCFAHAGGNTQVFRSWQAALPPHVRVKPIERPGSGTRLAEPLVYHYESLVDQLTDELAYDLSSTRRELGAVRYAVFGHSAGAMFGFGVACRMAEKLGEPPAHLFVSAGIPPHIARLPRSHLTDAELLQEMHALAGTPTQLLAHADLRNLFLPIFRADLSAHEGAVRDWQRRIHCPMTLLAADQDRLEANVVWDWRWYSSHGVQQVLLHGDHFSVVYAPTEMLGHIATALAGQDVGCVAWCA